MIIDIDIKIANSKGKLIHTFSKRFNERLDLSDIENSNSKIKDFEDFLAEYLTESGRIVRKKLIDQMSENPQSNPNSANEDNFLWDDTALDVSDSEMEYQIRIGKNKVIAGKIPFQRLNRLNSVTDALDMAEDAYLGMSDMQIGEDKDMYKDLQTGFLQPGYSKKDISEDFVRNLEKLMIQAIQKYESCFYHTDIEKKKPPYDYSQ